MNEHALLQAAKAIEPDLFGDDEDAAKRAAYPVGIAQARKHVLKNLRQAITAYEAEQEPPLTASQLADALGYFWNAAMFSADGSNDWHVRASISAVVDGVSAVQTRLAESAAGKQEATDANP